MVKVLQYLERIVILEKYRITSPNNVERIMILSPAYRYCERTALINNNTDCNNVTGLQYLQSGAILCNM